MKTPYQIQNKILKNITHTCYFYKIIQILFLLQFYNFTITYFCIIFTNFLHVSIIRYVAEKTTPKQNSYNVESITNKRKLIYKRKQTISYGLQLFWSYGSSVKEKIGIEVMIIKLCDLFALT